MEEPYISGGMRRLLEKVRREEEGDSAYYREDIEYMLEHYMGDALGATDLKKIWLLPREKLGYALREVIEHERVHMRYAKEGAHERVPDERAVRERTYRRLINGSPY